MPAPSPTLGPGPLLGLSPFDDEVEVGPAPEIHLPASVVIALWTSSAVLTSNLSSVIPTVHTSSAVVTPHESEATFPNG
jgi:hypothetical protein